MGFFDQKRTRSRQAYQSKKEEGAELDRKAKRKRGKQFIETSSSSSGDETKDFVKLVVDQALATIIAGLPSHQRQDWKGEVDPQQQGSCITVPVTLTHRKARGVKIEGQILIPIMVVQQNSGDKARSYGRELGKQLLDRLRSWKHEFRQEFEGDYDARAQLALDHDTVCGADEVPDMTEAMAVAELLDRTRCAICDYTDLDYPDWGDECSHTPEERAGD